MSKKQFLAIMDCQDKNYRKVLNIIFTNLIKRQFFGWLRAVGVKGSLLSGGVTFAPFGQLYKSKVAAVTICRQYFEPLCGFIL